MGNGSVIMGKKYNECILINFHGRNIVIFGMIYSKLLVDQLGPCQANMTNC